MYRYYRMSVLRCLAFFHGRRLDIPRRVLIVAPHPDDEILGCGGIIQGIREQNKDVAVAVLTGGEKSHGGCCDLDEVVLKNKRRELSRKAGEVVGMDLTKLYFLDFPDSKITESDVEVNKLERLITEFRPGMIFVPHIFEGWADHVEAGKIIGKLTREREIRVVEYCVWFWYNPYYRFGQVRWHDALLYRMSRKERRNKREAIRVYMNAKASCGKPYSGVLPSILLTANRWRNELFFERK